MAKVIIEADELYPHYVIDTGLDYPVPTDLGGEVPDELLEEYERAKAEFMRMRNEMARYYEKQEWAWTRQR